MKPDYFVSLPFLEGLLSSKEFQKKGMPIDCLNNWFIYPLYGVYMPTQQEYLNIFSNFVS